MLEKAQSIKTLTEALINIQSNGQSNTSGLQAKLIQVIEQELDACIKPVKQEPEVKEPGGEPLADAVAAAEVDFFDALQRATNRDRVEHLGRLFAELGKYGVSVRLA